MNDAQGNNIITLVSLINYSLSVRNLFKTDLVLEKNKTTNKSKICEVDFA